MLPESLCFIISIGPEYERLKLVKHLTKAANGGVFFKYVNNKNLDKSQILFLEGRKSFRESEKMF